MLKKIFLIAFVALIVLVNNSVLAQSPPSITYPAPQIYTPGVQIAPLLPTNTGGVVYPANYTAPISFASYPTPFSITIDASDNVYTTNNATGDLTKFNSAGTILFTVNTGAIQASEVAVDGLGNIYVSQFTTNSVLKYSSTGTLLATITGFQDPYGIAFDAANNAYVANYFSGSILEIQAGTTAASAYLTGFNMPYGLAIDAAGNMYVSEVGVGDVIQVAAGTLTRTSLASGFNGPRHLNKDSFGNIYVADFGNNSIDRISPSGTVTVVLSAGLTSPRQAAFDSSGNLFVANYGTNAFLKSVPTSYSINASLPVGLSFNTSTGAITGTPVSQTAQTTFTITAYNAFGSSSAAVNITVRPNPLVQSAPVVTTLAATSVSAMSATLNGLSNYGGSSTAVSFIYGTNANLLNATTVNAATNNPILAPNTGNSTLTLQGLSPLTTYYFAVTATDSVGTTQGTMLSFTTPGASNATLSNLAISAGTLSPSFAGSTNTYSASVGNATSSMTVTPATADPNATVTINGTAVNNLSASGQIALNVGVNTITTVVTAQDGVTTDVYTLTVTRGASSTASLTNLAVSSGTLSPSFTTSGVNYTASVGNAVTSITVTPTLADPTATVTVNGLNVAPGTASAGIPLVAGSNTITTVVTAQDGTTTNSYSIIITRAPSTNALLSALSITPSTPKNVVPGAGNGNFAATVSNTVSSVTITPITQDSTATVTVNGMTVASGSTSQTIPLAVGANTITTVVTAQDGVTTQSYILTINRAPSSNANLANIAISSGTLNPSFVTGTTNYSASVSYATKSITLTPTVADVTATVTVNGASVASSSASAGIPLNVGPNTITTLITAADGTTIGTYTIVVTRLASSNAALSALALSAGTLSPVFAAGTNNYTATVSNATASITISPATSDPNATVAVNGVSVISGSPSANIPLNGGPNTIATVVTAADGVTTATYTTIVTRTPSAIASLSNLAVSSGALSPSFATSTGSYTESVSNAISSVTVTPTVTDPTSTVTINGSSVTSGSASSSIPLNAGPNTITTVVTAQDGVTTATYTLTITRPPSSNALLNALSITPVTAKTVVPGTAFVNYTASVANTVTSVILTPVTQDPTATVAVNGTVVTSGSASPSIALAVGSNTITTVVTAQDGVTTKSYIITITRGASSNASLGNLSVSSGTLSPAFATSVNSYTASVPFTNQSIALTPTVSDPTATVTINGASVTSGSASANIPLNVGQNTITTVITAADGVTTATYTLVVTRLQSSNAALSALALSSGTLNPVFATGTKNYSASVSNSTTSVTITPATSDPNATVTVNATSVTSGSASSAIPLKVGANNIAVAVTAPDGTTINTYTVTVNRAPSVIASLSSLAISSGTLSPSFATGTTSYTVSVSNAVGSVTVTPVVTDPTATVTVNGATVASGSASASIALNAGSNTINTIVTAQDGVTISTYKIVITRAPSTDAILDAIAITPVTNKTVVSGPGYLNYTASVANTVSSVTLTPLADDSTATIKIYGTPVQSGAASGAIHLAVGSNTIITVVTAQDGKTFKIYYLTITRAPSSNATLANLAFNSGTLSPSFAPGTMSYTLAVSNATTSVKELPTSGDPTATITVNGSVVKSGAASAGIPVSVGQNTITTSVTSQDGTAVDTYIVTVIRASSSNAGLASLSINPVTLSPQFATGTNGYTASVSNAVKSVKVTPKVADTTAAVTVNGKTVASGTASPAIPLAVGTNTITTIVTAQDGVTTQTYTATIVRAPSSDALLTTISTNPNAAKTAVSGPGYANYTALVANAVSSVTITAVAHDTTATVAINGKVVKSGTASAAIPLVVGPNTITAVVTAQDGVTVNSYIITVNRLPSSDALLSSLNITPSTPKFQAAGAGFVNYTATVANAVTSITVTPVTVDSTATVTVNGTPVASGTASAAIPLTVGTNTIITVVTAQDGTTTRSYYTTVTRKWSSNVSLANLALSSGNLNPAFATGTRRYSVRVGNAITFVTETPTTSDSTAIVTVNGIVVNSGAASDSIPLMVGPNLITTIVTGQDRATAQIYSITVVRAPADASLTNLSLSLDTLSPSFTPDRRFYTAVVTNATTSISVTPTAMDSTANIKVNGVQVATGTSSLPVSLNVGPNTISILVTEPDSVTMRTYTVIVVRARSSNANLANLTESTGTLSPAFATTTNAYNVTVSDTTRTLTVTPTTSDSTATIMIRGVKVPSGTTSAPLYLPPGTDTIKVRVVAQDWVTQNLYTIVVTHLPSSTATLSSLALSKGALSPAFAKTTNYYSASVANDISSITVTPRAVVAESAITVNGTLVASNTASSPIALIPGQNTITVIVTAPDGVTTDTYTVVVTRASGNANLANLQISNASLFPTFSHATTNYFLNVNNAIAYIALSPKAADTAATVTVNGTPVAYGAWMTNISLRTGLNTIATTVTASDGVTQKTYTITINRLPASIFGAPYLALSNGTVSPGFTKSNYNFTASLSSAMAFIPSMGNATNHAVTIRQGSATTIASPLALAAAETNAQTPLNRVNQQPVTPVQPGVDNPETTPQLVNDDVVVHQAVSPNGDGINDFLQIDGITNYQDNKLMIMNRNGTPVFEIKGYDNSSRIFDGRSNKTGAMLQTGTYFYMLDYSVNGITKHKTGYILLKY